MESAVDRGAFSTSRQAWQHFSRKVASAKSYKDEAKAVLDESSRVIEFLQAQVGRCREEASASARTRHAGARETWQFSQGREHCGCFVVQLKAGADWPRHLPIDDGLLLQHVGLARQPPHSAIPQPKPSQHVLRPFLWYCDCGAA